MSSTTPLNPSRPMDIPGRRARSASESSDGSAMAATPGRSDTGSPPRVKIQTNGGLATSPVMSFFFPGSPTKAPGSLFSRPPGAAAASAIADDDDAAAPEPSGGVLPASAHARRFSSSWAKPIPTGPDDRSSGLLRRLSLSSAFGKPTFPGTHHGGGTSPPNTSPVVVPKSAVHAKRPSPSSSPSPGPGRMRRSATIAVPNANPIKHRAPSPMGERILKGHFDGFV